MAKTLKQFNIPPVWTAIFAVSALVLAGLDPFARFQANLIGILLILCAILLFGWSVREFRRHKTTFIPRKKPSALISNGPFRISRNPIYLAFCLLVLGMSVWLGSWLSFLGPVGLFAFLHKNYVLPEERKMREGLGDAEVDAYFARTGRWVWFL